MALRIRSDHLAPSYNDSRVESEGESASFSVPSDSAWATVPRLWSRSRTVPLAPSTRDSQESISHDPKWMIGGRPRRWVGEYLLIERLGGGGQGTVWKAVRTEPFVELVALKMLSPLFGQDERRVAQLRREAERAARLSSPSILPAYDFGVAEGIVYMAMPLIRGFALSEVIRQRRHWLAGRPLGKWHPLALLADKDYEERIVRIVSRIAKALSEAHSASVVHRDIKPSNILIDENSLIDVYLSDFGLGRDLDVATPAQLKDGAGTPIYMAPEKLLKGYFDEVRCDVYSLGATLFEALTTTQPFQPPADMPRIVWPTFMAAQKTPGIRDVKPDLDETLEAIVFQSMSRDPETRYTTADQFRVDLDDYLAGKPPRGLAARSR